MRLSDTNEEGAWGELLCVHELPASFLRLFREALLSPQSRPTFTPGL